MEDLLKLSFKMIISIFEIPSKKPTLARCFQRVYKIRIVTVFPALAMVVLKYPSLDLTWTQFLSEEYQFNKNKPYLRNISRLMSLSLKMESIFSIVATLDKIEYELKNGVMLKVPKKLVIAITNPLVCYLIVKVNYIRPLLIIKLIFISIEFKVFKEVSYTYDGLAKPKRETKSS